MSDAPLKAVLKAGAGYSDPWVTVEAYTPQELVDRLNGLTDGALQAVVTTAGLFQGAHVVAQGVQSPQQAAPQAPAAPQQSSGGGWSQPAQQAPAPVQNNGVRLHPEGKSCGACNSVLQYKEVNRKSDGKTFKFWTCPNQRSRDDAHASEFAN